MSATLKLSKFDLMTYASGFIGKSHLRWGGYEQMVNLVHPQLSDDEREFLYTYLKRDFKDTFKGQFRDNTAYEYYRRMLARFNPANQFTVVCEGMVNGHLEKETVHAYIFQDYYWVDWNRRIPKDVMKSVTQRPFHKCRNHNCASCDDCQRYTCRDIESTTLPSKSGDDDFYRYVKDCDLMIDNAKDEER